MTDEHVEPSFNDGNGASKVGETLILLSKPKSDLSPVATAVDIIGRLIFEFCAPF